MRTHRNVSRISVFAAAVACLLAVTAVTAAPASAAEDYLTFTNQNSRKCLDVQHMSQQAGAVLQQWDCWNGVNQQWLKEDPDGDGWFQLRNRHSGMCLEVFIAGVLNGAAVVQWDCWGAPHQQWQVAHIAADGIWAVFGIRNKHSGKCLEVYGFSQDNGGAVVQWDCWGGHNQRWDERSAYPPIIR